MAQPAETECSCVPVNVLKSDIDEGRSPFGDEDESCYQVDSKLLYGNSSVDIGKTQPKLNKDRHACPLGRSSEKKCPADFLF